MWKSERVVMKEKKVFILAVPTVIIIIAFIVGIVAIYYNRNLKKLSREDAKTLASKVALIDNISCEIITEGTGDDGYKTVSDYKLKDGKLISKVDSFKIYDDSNEKKLIQIDDDSKVAYEYSEYKSEIDNFRNLICSAEKLLESEDLEYSFKEYSTANGIKCANFTLSNNESSYNIWLDRSTGMIVKMECKYFSGNSTNGNNIYYRYQIGNVSDEMVKKPDLTGYSIVDL